LFIAILIAHLLPSVVNAQTKTGTPSGNTASSANSGPAQGSSSSSAIESEMLALEKNGSHRIDSCLNDGKRMVFLCE
jgi:hypothetical protein